MKKRKILSTLGISVMCMLCALTGCEEEQTEDGGEKTGIYYEGIDEKEFSQKYNGGLVVFRGLHYDNKAYTSVESFSSANDKSELPLEKIVGEELATVYGNNGVIWSADKDELDEVTVEGKLYKVKGYDDDFRVCLYYEVCVEFDGYTSEVYAELDGHTSYALIIFDCMNDIYLDKGSDLFTDRIDLSKAVKVTTNSIPIDLNDENLQAFIEALNNGTFIASSDEAYPDLSNVSYNEIIFYDECGLENAISVYENGYVTMSTNGQGTVTEKVDELACKRMVWSWEGRYRADIVTSIEDNWRESLNIKLEVDEKDVRHIFVYVKKAVKPVNGEGITTEEIIINNETDVLLDTNKNVVFTMKESGFLDNVDEDTLKDVYVELKRQSGSVIYFRYAYSEEELENQEYMALDRSEY